MSDKASGRHLTRRAADASAQISASWPQELTLSAKANGAIRVENHLARSFRSQGRAHAANNRRAIKKGTGALQSDAMEEFSRVAPAAWA
jgi:hypothetical protein